MFEFQGSGQALRPAPAYRPSAVASGSDFARAKSPRKEGEEKEEEEGKMMLKIDEITHFFRIVKSQNTIRICVSEAQTSVQPRDFL